MDKKSLRLIALAMVLMTLTVIAVQAHQLTASERGLTKINNNSDHRAVLKLWDLVKRLENADINRGGLHIALLMFNGHLLPKMTKTQQQTLASSKPLNITVFDVDRGQSFKMKITKFAQHRYYLLSGGWTFEFVQPRGLKMDDRVGLAIRGSVVDFGKFPPVTYHANTKIQKI